MAAYRGEVGGARFDLATLSCKINFKAEDSGLPEGDDRSAQNPQRGQGGDPPSLTTPPAPDPKPEGKTFTDEQLDRIIGKRSAKEVEAAKAATEAAIAEQLGVSIDEAKKIIEASKQAEEDKKSEIDKLKEQNESIKKDSETKVGEVQREHHIDRVKLHLIRAGVALPEDTAENPDASEKALDRVVGLISVPVGARVESSTGRYVPFDNAGSNGTNTAVGILYTTVKVTNRAETAVNVPCSMLRHSQECAAKLPRTSSQTGGFPRQRNLELSSRVIFR